MINQTSGIGGFPQAGGRGGSIGRRHPRPEQNGLGNQFGQTGQFGQTSPFGQTGQYGQSGQYGQMDPMSQFGQTSQYGQTDSSTMGQQRPPGGGIEAKIQEGIQNGTISQEEAQILMAKHQQIEQTKQSAGASGQVSQQDHTQLQALRQEMHQMLSQFSQG